MMVEDHPDWEMLLHAAAALRSGDHKPYRAMRRDWDHRASLMNPDSVAQTVAEWRLPFNPLYRDLGGADLSNTDPTCFNRMKKVLAEREKADTCWACHRERGVSDKAFAAHEFWQWDDVQGIRRLIAVHFICSDCHYLAHHTYWRFISCREERDIHLIRLFCQVNQCSIIEAYAHVKLGMALCSQRQNKHWIIDTSPVLEYFGLAE